MRLGRILGAIGGALIGGPIGAAVGYSVGNASDEASRGKKELRKAESAQTQAYEQQRELARGEQDRMNKQLEASRSKTAQGIARASRSRIRGGIFGDQQPAAGLNQRLG